MLNRTVRILSAIVLSIASSVAGASVLVVNFDEIPQGTYFENLTSHGVRISPHCHVDIFPPSDAGDNIMGYDTSGCSGGNFNEDFIGPAGTNDANVYVDYFGYQFDFLSFVREGFEGFARSSKGGFVEFGAFKPGSTTPSLVELKGTEWAGVEWIEFGGMCPGAPCIRLDDLTLRVPTPGTLPLIAIATVALIGARRRKVPWGTSKEVLDSR